MAMRAYNDLPPAEKTPGADRRHKARVALLLASVVAAAAAAAVLFAATRPDDRLDTAFAAVAVAELETQFASEALAWASDEPVVDEHGSWTAADAPRTTRLYLAAYGRGEVRASDLLAQAEVIAPACPACAAELRAAATPQ